MSGAEVHGTFVWHEWMGRDPVAAAAFYGRVFGWTAQAWERDPSYTVWATPRGPAGGAMRLAADAEASGESPGWLAYVAVANVEATAATAERLGGRIVKGVTALPDAGRYAVLADPQSALIGIFTPPPSGADAGASQFVWHELGTADHSAAFRFYQELFAWERLGDHDLGAMGTYLIFGRNGRQFGGLFNRPPGSTGAPRWLAYVEVSSATHAAQAATAAGGRVTSAPHQVPGGSWVAQLADPQGVAIAVHQARAAAAAAPKPAASSTRAASPEAAAKPTAAQAPKPTARRPAAGKAAKRAAPARRAAGTRTGKAATRGAAAKRKRSGTSRKPSAGRKTAAKRAAGRARIAKRASARRAAAKKSARRKTAKRPARRAAGRAARKPAARRSKRKAVRRKNARRRGR